MSSAGLRFFSHTGGSGYGNASCDYIYTLSRMGVPIRWSPLSELPYEYERVGIFLPAIRKPIRRRLKRLWQKDIDYDTVIVALAPRDHFQTILKTRSR